MPGCGLREPLGERGLRQLPRERPVYGELSHGQVRGRAGDVTVLGQHLEAALLGLREPALDAVEVPEQDVDRGVLDPQPRAAVDYWAPLAKL